MSKLVACRFCGVVFVPAPNKPGLRDVCLDPVCVGKGNKARPEVVLVGGNMVWDHKTAPTLVIRRDITEAKRWAKIERRLNASSPIRSILCNRESKAGAEVEGKKGSGAESHAGYVSRLGEKRVVK